MPEMKGKRVLDLGCGHGSLCVNIAEAGAERVVGVDLECRLINFAITYTALKYPHLKDRVEFLCDDIANYDGEKFDYIVSKYTFEHIIELDKVLGEAKKRLKPGGRIYSGFGPLYWSPLGDHGRTYSHIPFGHVVQTEKMIVDRLNRNNEQPITSIADLGLNKLTPADYRRIFKNSGMNLVFYRQNTPRPNSMIRKINGIILSAFSKIPLLEKYFVVNIWCILEVPPETHGSVMNN
jgi:SAM-dependent methyltransferase